MKPIEYLIWATGGHDSDIPHKARNEAKAELKRLREIEAGSTAMKEIVEGARNERWAADGRRLKDTPEWCALYCALSEPNVVVSHGSAANNSKL